MPATPHRSTPATTSRPARAGPIARPRTYEQPALADLPLNPRRGTYVLNLILQQHNWRHSSKHKGHMGNIGHNPIAERARFCHWLFTSLRQHPKRFKLDPRSFSGRHVEARTCQ